MNHRIKKIDYVLDVTRKFRWPIVAAGTVAGLLLLMTFFIQSYTAMALLKFQDTKEKSGSSALHSQYSVFLSKADGLRDRYFNYLNSPIYFNDLAMSMTKHKEGYHIAKKILESQNNLLVQFKKIFIDADKSALLKEVPLPLHLQKILSIKKDGDSALSLRVTAGTPEYAQKLTDLLMELTKDLILRYETKNYSLVDEHLAGQIIESEIRIKDIEADLIFHKEKELSRSTNSSNSSNPIIEVEKNLRDASVEQKRLEFLIAQIEREVNLKTSHKQNGEQYVFTDHSNIERIQKLDLDRESVAAKVQSLSQTLMRMKSEQKLVPTQERDLVNLQWKHELEVSLHKDLLIKSREIGVAKMLLKNSNDVVGETSIVQGRNRMTKFFRFLTGFILGSLSFLAFIFYFHSLFPVVKDKVELDMVSPNGIQAIIPKIPFFVSQKSDLWKSLPPNHYAMGAFRTLMDETDKVKTIAVLGPQKGIGKSFIVANIAENLARYGKKVLIIDTNWKNSTSHRRFKGHQQIKVQSPDVFKHQNDVLLDKVMLYKMIKENESHFDHIIIDTQSSSNSDDAFVLATLVNLNIVVSSYLETHLFRLEDTVQKLKVTGINDFVLVLNKSRLQPEVLVLQSAMDNLIMLQDKVVYKKTGG